MTGRSRQARRVTLLVLAALVAAFAATWVTLPSRGESVRVPAALFARGLTHDDCVEFASARGTAILVEWRETPFQRCVRWKDTNRINARDIDTLKDRVVVVFGSAAAIVVLVGLAFGAARRRQ